MHNSLKLEIELLVRTLRASAGIFINGKIVDQVLANITSDDAIYYKWPKGFIASSNN